MGVAGGKNPVGRREIWVFLDRKEGFRSLTEALDTTTAQGRLVFHMFGALAERRRAAL
jgi:DNA invertase Pin-like site-specific DNA recombinase